MTTEEIIEYYQGLLIMQYALSPNAQGTIAAFVKQIIANQIAAQVRDGFNFAVDPIGWQQSDAYGAQLDAVGSYRGAKRLIYGLNFGRQFFSMPVYGQSDADTVPGFATYGQSPITDLWLTYILAEQPIYYLTDDQLYRLTQFRAQLHSRLLSVKETDDMLFNFFGNNVAVFEDSAMKITYIDLISDPDTLFGILNASASLPRPAGVQMDVFRSDTLNEFFGYQIYGQSINPDFVGFGLYGTPQTGSFVRYP